MYGCGGGYFVLFVCVCCFVVCVSDVMQHLSLSAVSAALSLCVVGCVGGVVREKKEVRALTSFVS